MKTYITIAGTGHYYGTDVFEKDMTVRLYKEPKNEYDRDAIRVEADGLGKVGYVANSVHTVRGESVSASRLYDRIGKKAQAKVVAIAPNAVICAVRKKCLKK